MTPMQMHVLSLSVSVGREVMLKVAAQHSTAQAGRAGTREVGRTRTLLPGGKEEVKWPYCECGWRAHWASRTC